MHLSSVEGMHAFRRFLRGTMGEHIFSFWLDAERYRRQTKPQNRRYSFREIQSKYLKGGSPFELTELMKWKSLCGGLNIGQDGKSFSAPIEITKRLCQPNISVFSANIFVPLQKIILEQLGSYWAPKFVVHREKIRMRHKDHRGKVIHASHISTKISSLGYLSYLLEHEFVVARGHGHSCDPCPGQIFERCNTHACAIFLITYHRFVTTT